MNKRAIKISIVFISIVAAFRLLCLYSSLIFKNVSAFSLDTSVFLSVQTGNSTQEISLWQIEKGGVFFLPSYADLSSCSFVYDNAAIELYMEDKAIESGQRLRGFDINCEYTFTLLEKEGGKVVFELPVVFMQSENLPSIYLNTESGSLDYIHEAKENREAAFMEIVDASGRVVFSDNIEALKGHGNTTWEDGEKKPYMLKLQREESLLGMDSGRKWILLANFFDGSYIRNTIGLELARMAGMSYISQSRYVDLYINNEYKGNYQLVEKIDVGEGRVAINNLEKENARVNPEDYKQNERFGEDDAIVKGLADMVNPQDITGGYLLERNFGGKYEDKVSGFITSSGERFVVRAPSYASMEEIAYINNVVQCVENAIIAADGIDVTTGLHYTELIDLQSFAKKYILEEVALNEANTSTSSWFYKPENRVSTKLFAGPAWDYDKAFANCSYYMNPNVLSKMYCYYKSADSTIWFYELYKKEEFVEEVKRQYQERFAPKIQEMLDEHIDEYADLIEKSVAMDQVRWQDGRNFEEEICRIKEWLGARKIFLDKVWVEDKKVYLIRYLQKERRKIENIESVFVGEKAKMIPKIEDENFLYWYVEENDTIFNPNQEIDKDITLLPIYRETEEK